MSNQPPLHQGHFYHIYNRGNNRETLFRTAQNYHFFLQRYSLYIEPVAATYAYCLLPNHFHFLSYMRTDDEQRQWHLQNQPGKPWQPLDPHSAFRKLFISYAMAYNRQEKRTGSLFQRPFRRKRIDSERYFTGLVTYIHRNPQTHGLVDDFREWSWSSYSAILSDKPTRVERASVLEWFSNRTEFIAAHEREIDKDVIFSKDDIFEHTKR